ncbi:MAG: YceD family protein [Candidatus Nanopelagicales bacterium]
MGIGVQFNPGKAMASLNPRDPLVFDVADLGRHAGAMMSVERELAAPAHLGAGLLSVPPGSPVYLAVRFESVIEGVLASGTVAVTVVGECARCLDPVEWDQTDAFSELFAYELGEGQDPAEVYLLEGDLLSLEPVVRDAVVLDLPLAPVCRPDCPGLCPECGLRLAEDPNHAHEQLDPRWAGLAGVDIPSTTSRTED